MLFRSIATAMTRTPLSPSPLKTPPAAAVTPIQVGAEVLTHTHTHTRGLIHLSHISTWNTHRDTLTRVCDIHSQETGKGRGEQSFKSQSAELNRYHGSPTFRWFPCQGWEGGGALDTTIADLRSTRPGGNPRAIPCLPPPLTGQRIVRKSSPC